MPTLVKYANEQPSLTVTSDFFHNFVKKTQLSQSQQGRNLRGSRLVEYDRGVENNILIAALMRYSDIDYAQAAKILADLDQGSRKQLFDAIFAPLDDHDIPIRELEYSNFVFEIVLDQGAYLELKRHRMMTQTPSPFTPRFGFSIPLQIEKAGLLDKYSSVMQSVETAYNALSEISEPAASYVLPNAFNRQVLLQSNLRSLYHFLALRTSSTAHFSMRRIAQQMADQTIEVLPEICCYIKRNKSESAADIQERFFYHV